MKEFDKKFTNLTIDDIFRENIQQDIETSIQDFMKLPEITVETKIAEILRILVVQLTRITEFSHRELLAISILYTHKYFRKYIIIYVGNKKHVKRKHVSEILEAIKQISSMIALRTSENDLTRTYQSLTNKALV